MRTHPTQQDDDIPPLSPEEERYIDKKCGDTSEHEDPDRWTDEVRSHPIRSAVGIVLVILLFVLYIKFHP